MKALDFRRWVREMKLSDTAAAEILGIGSRNTIKKYLDEGAPRYIGLACAAYAAGLDEWVYVHKHPDQSTS